MTAAEILRQAAEINEAKTLEYGSLPDAFGPIVMAMMPKGVAVYSYNDMNRWHLFTQIVVKVARYAANFEQGGHEDSLRDLAVYAAMLQSYDANLRERQCRTAD